MLQPGREFNVSGYRYGFNGKENDNEVKGEGNQQDYGMRIYDPRLGRFLSVDPLIYKYPELTPYQFSSNRPIDGIDLDGAEYLRSTESYITLNVKYNPNEKTVTAIISLNSDNITPATNFYLANSPWTQFSTSPWAPNEIGSRKAIIGEYVGRVKTSAKPTSENRSQWNKNQEDATMEDLKDQPTATAPFSAAIERYAFSKKERREIERTKNFTIPIFSGASPKADVLMFVLDLLNKAAVERGNKYINDDYRDAAKQANEYVPKVMSQIYNAIQNQVIKEPDFENISAIANYLLYGKEPKITFKFEGKTYERVDNKLLNLAKKVRDGSFNSGQNSNNTSIIK